jgi:hypothetical protein
VSSRQARLAPPNEDLVPLRGIARLGRAIGAAPASRNCRIPNGRVAERPRNMALRASGLGGSFYSRFTGSRPPCRT